MSAQPVVQENLSEYLIQFDRTLDSLMKGEKNCTLQLRDLDLFRTIKHKIENYPLLKEIYDNLGSKRRPRLRGLTRSTGNLTRRSDSDFPTTRSFYNGGDSHRSITPSNRLLQVPHYSQMPILPLGVPTAVPPSEEDMLYHDEILLTAHDIVQFICTGILEVKLMLSCFKKLKIAAFSSYSNTKERSKTLRKMVYQLLFQQDLGLVMHSEMLKQHWNVISAWKFFDHFSKPLKSNHSRRRSHHLEGTCKPDLVRRCQPLQPRQARVLHCDHDRRTPQAPARVPEERYHSNSRVISFSSNFKACFLRMATSSSDTWSSKSSMLWTSMPTLLCCRRIRKWQEVTA